MGDADGGDAQAAQQKLGIRAAFDIAQGILLVGAAAGGRSGALRALTVCVRPNISSYSWHPPEGGEREGGTGARKDAEGGRARPVPRCCMRRSGCPIGNLAGRYGGAPSRASVSRDAEAWPAGMPVAEPRIYGIPRLISSNLWGCWCAVIAVHELHAEVPSSGSVDRAGQRKPDAR